MGQEIQKTMTALYDAIEAMEFIDYLKRHAAPAHPKVHIAKAIKDAIDNGKFHTAGVVPKAGSAKPDNSVPFAEHFAKEPTSVLKIQSPPPASEFTGFSMHVDAAMFKAIGPAPEPAEALPEELQWPFDKNTVFKQRKVPEKTLQSRAAKLAGPPKLKHPWHVWKLPWTCLRVALNELAETKLGEKSDWRVRLALWRMSDEYGAVYDERRACIPTHPCIVCLRPDIALARLERVRDIKGLHLMPANSWGAVSTLGKTS
jgi:hypothetical protein